MTRRLIGVLLLISMQHAAMACINEYPVDGALARKSQALAKLSADKYLRELTEGGKRGVALDELRKKAEDGDFHSETNLAAGLLRRGEIAEAIAILQVVEQQRPGEYITAANLGTAYELAGDNRQALEWITKGLERNPESHDKSEWLHRKILETKLDLAEHPDRLTSRSIVDLDFGTDRTVKRPVLANGRDTEGRTLQETRASLEYQLRERLALVPAPDPVVGDLLLTLGNLLWLDGSLEHAEGVYKLAQSYGAPRPELVSTRLATVRQLRQAREGQGARFAAIAFLVLGGVAVAVALIAPRRAAR